MSGLRGRQEMLSDTRRTIGVAVCVVKLCSRTLHVRRGIDAERRFSERGDAKDDLRERSEKNSGAP